MSALHPLRMKRHFIFFLWTVCPFAFSQSGAAIQVANPGFEMLQDGQILQWHAVSGSPEAFSPDRIIRHQGENSLHIEHLKPQQTCITSAPVALEIGKLYALSGWIKTVSARTDSNQRYPTPVPACLRMASMPITAHSPAVGGDQDWRLIRVLFFASQAQERVCLHLGYRGDATGQAWFDDIQIHPVEEITQYMPKERIKRYGPAFRFDEQGWIYIHIEGKPHARGFQYGYLTAQEIKTYISRLAINRNKDNPAAAWRDLRTQADILFLRKYESEYLQEMQGIADGAKKNNVQIYDRAIDLLDIVTINSYVDISYGADGILKTPHALSGQRFQTPEDEMDMPESLHKCSSFLANKTATADQRIVFGQLFMWNGYTGPSWDVFVDVVPDQGHRLVYETFAGGIHSGADFYINSAGIMIGETTVNQTPFKVEGTPQSNRIRLAAQYASSIDEVVKYLWNNNNGLYTNDWLIGDCKTDEIAIYCLGTQAAKLWRSSQREFYDGQVDWYWSNNNPKSLDIRKEYIVNANNAPVDLSFRPWDRDLAFWKFYEQHRGKIDAELGMKLVGSSPINRPHACDGKITTSAMAEKLMFHAHYGKVTCREMFVNENGRIPDLPLAIPRLSLGYTTFSPLTLAAMIAPLPRADRETRGAEITSEPDSLLTFPQEKLWANTVYPASNRDNWFVSATAGYWQTLHHLPKDAAKARVFLAHELAELNCRLLYTAAREGALIPSQAQTNYHLAKHYYVPKIRGTYLLHQIRLKVGNQRFAAMMNRLHDQYAGKNLTTADFIRLAESVTGDKLQEMVDAWINRDDLPDIHATCTLTPVDSLYRIHLQIRQNNKPYPLVTSVRIKTAKQYLWKKVEITRAAQEWSWETAQQPLEVTLNAGNDYPVAHDLYYTFTNFYDDFNSSVIVYGTARQIEANHTLARRFAQAAADRFTETILPVRKDCEFDVAEFKDHDVILLSLAGDNQWIKMAAEKSGAEFGNGFFTWRGVTHAAPHEGLMVVVPNPYNPERMVTLIAANSALQLHHMAKALPRFPQWALFKDDQVVERGYHEPNGAIALN